MSSSLTEFAEAVYSSPPRKTKLARFVDAVYGKEDEAPFRDRAAVRRKWHTDWRRRVGRGRDGDRDVVTVCTARMGKGEGKSALVQDAAMDVDAGFAAELSARVVFRAEQAVDLVNTLSRGEAWIYDEAGEGLLNTEFWSEESRLLVKAVMMSRDSHTIGFLCIPSIRMFNAAFLNSLVDYWIRVERRGVALVHPRPPERYTSYRGIGWFPDPEWNPYEWDHPKDWAPDRARVWKEYRGLRRRARTAALTGFRERMEQLREGGGRAPPKTETCTRCGLQSNAYNVQTHKCPGKRA